MPYEDPDPTDPLVLVGVVLPTDAETVRDMAGAFADEFARLGLERERILALYRNPFYRGAHAAWQALGEDEIARLVDESVAVWSRLGSIVCEAESADSPDAGDDAVSPGRLLMADGFLKVVR